MTTFGTYTSKDVEQEGLFRQLHNYPWAEDNDFQSGLRAILGPDPAPERREHLTLRAQCFYFSRQHNISIDFDAYQKWCASTIMHATAVTQAADDVEPPNHKVPSPSAGFKQSRSNSTSQSSGSEAPYPISFSEMVKLITTNQPILGVKEVPDTLLTGKGSQSTESERKKPWEKEQTNEGATSSTILI